MKKPYTIGLDIHKKTIAYCIKEENGTIIDQGNIPATLLLSIVG